jgi:uncharacterized membrane protein
MSKKKRKTTHTKNAMNVTRAQKNRNSADKREAKKAAVLGTEKKGYLPLFVAVACALIIVGGGLFYIMYKPSDSSPVAATSSPAGSTLTQATFPVSLFEDGKARHFQHVAGGFTIKFFILKSSDGIIRAAFDACDVCWPAGKGYYQEGDYMVCRNCGRRFASVLVNEVKGGCNPAPLNRNVENGKVIIQVKDILEGKQYFNFS